MALMYMGYSLGEKGLLKMVGDKEMYTHIGPQFRDELLHHHLPTSMVILYRSGLVTAAASFVFATSTAFLPNHSFLTDLIKPNFDFFYALCAVGLGLSLFLIHIYVTEIKRTLQLLWGLVFKEGLCYGKLEAGVLTFVVPTVLLGHLTGLMDDGLKTTLLGLWMALFVVFAERKFTQPIKDDIGDKSVFIFNSLPEEEKKLLIEKLNSKLM
ncbi:uncharacterized protein LOC141700573 [Apium graveolens]|uniref:uncharacterized protein LOC141700573 n=1 Tax=Apium graveolens TaxID=4045 RepID=UPI003D7BDAA2